MNLNQKLLFISLLVTTATTENIEVEENVATLTRNFFANLQEDPQLKDKSFTESSKMFIDKLVANYLDLMKYALGVSKHMVTRRSLPIDDVITLTKDYTGIHILSGFNGIFNVRAKYSKDIVMFYHEYDGYIQWYAIVLEGETQKMANTMVIYKLKEMEFEKLQTIAIQNGSKLAVHTAEQTVFIAVAEYNPLKQNLYEETGVYEFTKNEELRKIQSLNIQYASDVKIWQDDHNLFLSLTQHMVNVSNKLSYEVNMPIYKWLGKHFDIIDEIKTYGAKCITPFTVGKSHFLAAANYQNNHGKTNIYSEIFKFDLNTDKFKPYQKILTNAAVDVKHFYFTANNVQEHFLVFANLFEIDKEGSQNYETDSIIYKYVEGYFMPFQSFKINGAMEWLPIISPNNAFVLLVNCKFEGIKAFQYNGWKFIESTVQYTTGVFSQGVVAMHSYQFNNKTILVIANENDHGETSNIFEVAFTHRNDLNQFQENMLNWCRQNTKTVEQIEFNPIMKNKDKSNDEPILQLGQSDVSSIIAENLEMLEIEDLDDTINEDFNELKNIMKNQSKQLDAIEKQVELSLQTNSTSFIKGNMNVQKLILNNNVSVFNTLNATTINSINVSDLINNVININEAFTIQNKIEIQEVRIENHFRPKFINDHPAASLIYRNLDYDLGHLIVKGTVTLNNINVRKKVNGIDFNTNNILLNKGDQSLRNLHANSLKIENVDVNENLGNFTFLSAKKIFVKGYVNNVDIETLNKFALRKNGPQMITGEYSFDKLHADNLFIHKMSGKNILDDLILINRDYEIIQSVQFVNDLVAKNILVKERLNGIPAVNGTLDVLLSNVPHMQHIRGRKTFETLQLQNPIKLQGKINSTRLDKMNPVSIIDEDLILNGSYAISGNVSIEQLIRAEDIQSKTKVLSIQRLWNKGLKLVEIQIPVHLQFQQQIHVDELFADEINGHNVNSFVIMGLKDPQYISGWKTFTGDLNILGSSKVTNMNGINLQEFESNVLKITGNQTLAGKHHFQSINANRVYNIKTRFGNHQWEDVITTNTNQKINGTTIITANSLQINTLQTKTLSSLHINGYDFNTLVNDTIIKGQEKQILGHTNFVALTVQNLAVQTLDLDDVPKTIENARATFQINADINLPNDIVIEKIFFNSHFNGVPNENFGHQWMFSESEQIIESDQNFDKLIIYGKLFIESGFINDINVIDISENSIKIDEPFHFGTVTFARGVASLQGVSLEGKFESLYLNDIVQSNTREEQIITGKTLFNNNVAIYGEVHFNGLVSGVNITHLCRFALSTDNNNGPYNLYVKGNAYFAKGPVVQYINTLPIKYILENAWFQNQEVYLTGHMHFDEVIFNQELIVDGLVDDVVLQDIAHTYFSKTKDQNINVTLDFDGTVIFRNGLDASEAHVEGLVCGLNIEEFIHTAVLDGYDQTFENIIYLDISEIRDLQGEYLVNKLNLQFDVMRYDKPNIVTGKKVIQNIKAYSMTINYNLKVQNVDLLWWLQNAVLKKGTFSISGEIVFNNHTQFSSQLSTQGVVNRQILSQDTVMLKSLPQTITGKKIFSGDSNFQSVKLKGYLNGLDLSHFLYNQAYKNQNIAFKTPIHFNAEIATPNVNIEKLYQGVNISRLIHNLTRFATIENYHEHYEKLLNTSSQVKNSLTAQAYFVDYYEVKQIYQMVHSIIPVTFENSSDQYLACIEEGNSNNYSIVFQVWDNEKEQFHHAKDVEDIQVPLQLHYIQKIIFQGKERWYIENKNMEDNSTLYKASIYDVNKDGLIEILPLMLHNGTKSVSTLTLPDKNNRSCIFLLFPQNPMLYCERQTDQDVSLELFQVFNTTNGIEATTYQIQDTICIFIVNKGTVFNDPIIDLWKYDARTGIFNIDQNFYTASPNSINVAFYRETSYLIIASGRLQNAKHAGLLNIYKYNNNTTKFEMFQNINLNAPLQVQFAELPTKELIMYVVTDNPAETIVIFSYEGVAGFQQRIIASTVPKTIAITSFNTAGNRHFVLAKNINETRVIESVFKGYKYL